MRVPSSRATKLMQAIAHDRIKGTTNAPAALIFPEAAKPLADMRLVAHRATLTAGLIRVPEMCPKA